VVVEFVSHYAEWHHILFKVRDADVSIRFYSEYLGMGAVKDLRDTEGNRCVWLRFAENPDAPLFVLAEDTRLKKTQIPHSSMQYFSFRLPDLKPVEEISAMAQKDNCLVEPAKYGGHARGYFCVVSDPDGNLLEFAYLLSPKPEGASS
jgi:lactoylglutathione lyase